ncbi:MAG: hypothetical protein OXC93_07075, partial [Rhodospirillaceae bacterium]|nr:hypothetical protein [Rhodospirillaceae bacterium]
MACLGSPTGLSYPDAVRAAIPGNATASLADRRFISRRSGTSSNVFIPLSLEPPSVLKGGRVREPDRHAEAKGDPSANSFKRDCPAPCAGRDS